MMKLEVLNLNLGKVIMRFYLMMAVVLLAGYTGVWALGLLALPIFLSAILGLRFTVPKGNEAKQITLSRKKEQYSNRA